jgi:DNA-directed RNA polymerase subunit beta'
MVLGIYYLTKEHAGTASMKPRRYSNLGELYLAYGHGGLMTHQPALVRMDPGTLIKMSPNGESIEVDDEGKVTIDGERGYLNTTIGRAIFNDILAPGMPFYNYELTKNGISGLISDCHRLLGRDATLLLLDDLKDLGFKAATRAGMSFAKDDMKIPDSKGEILDRTQDEIDEVAVSYEKGLITDGERYLKIIDLWTACREEVGDALIEVLKADVVEGNPYVNPILCMVESGARGSIDQIRQLAGMRGLMAKPSGAIIETPIKANFREGLKVLEYFSSTHGARKGLADTALKTADAGYLTRKLTDVAQNVVITSDDCGTMGGVIKIPIYKGEKLVLSLGDAIRGRTARQTVIDPILDEIIVREDELITEQISSRIEELGIEKFQVRSALTCESRLGCCSKCYGMDLSRGIGAERGLAAGIIAAQSIGEPGTQLTMRTFHIGGTASRSVEQSDTKSRRDGTIQFSPKLRAVKNADGNMVSLDRNGEFILNDAQGREIDRYEVHMGAALAVTDGQEVKASELLMTWDPHYIPILAEAAGKVRFEDLIEGKTMLVERDARTGTTRSQVIEHKGDLHPQVAILDKAGDPVSLFPIPVRAYIEVLDGSSIKAGALLAKTSREISGTQDITGGLPRLTELFEARKPKEPAVMSQIDGVVEIGDKKRGKRTIIVRALSPKGEVIEEKEHMVAQGKHLRVNKGDEVSAGDPLVDGALVPHDILEINGEEAVQNYLLGEIQSVYRSQGVTIDDKHIEIILGRMMRKIEIKDPGDSSFLPGAIIDRAAFRIENDRLRLERRKPATGHTLLLGITKASLSSESFISAASFQETTKVLTEAAMASRLDHLVGLKENVILGHMIPTGTGFRDHYRTRVKKNIDFGEIGKGMMGSGSSSIDPDMEALFAGDPGLEAGMAMLTSTGTEDLAEIPSPPATDSTEGISEDSSPIATAKIPSVEPLEAPEGEPEA